MTDRTQFEAMLEALINEDQETAKEIFHNIVVAKSREIYEELLESDFSESTEDEYKEKDLEEGNPFASDEEGSDDEPADDEEGSDDEPADDEEGDEEGEESPFGDEEGDEEGEEGDIEDRVMDLEDALDELKAEFEELMAGEEGEGHHADLGAMGDMDMGPDAGLDEIEGEELPPGMFAEYVNKVALPKHGDNGTNTKSAVAGKNDMGGTTANIAKNFSTTSGGTKGGLLNPSPKEDNAGNINKPGANAGKTAFKKKEPGHGAEKGGSKESADNKRSIVGSRK